jgi:hypothetical protein
MVGDQVLGAGQDAQGEVLGSDGFHAPRLAGNMMLDEGEDNVKAAYRDHYARLAAVKKAVDPGNLFRVNQNIKPS